MNGQHTTYVSCPHMLGHATQSHHLVPDCLETEGIGKHKLSCALETIHTWTYEAIVAELPVRVTPNQFNACYLGRDWAGVLGYEDAPDHMKRHCPGLKRGCRWRGTPCSMRANLTHCEIVLPQGEIVPPPRKTVPPHPGLERDGPPRVHALRDRPSPIHALGEGNQPIHGRREITQPKSPPERIA